MISRGVQNNSKPKTLTENSVPEPNFRVPEPKYLIFSVRVPKPIFFSGYRFGVRVGLFNQTGTQKPEFFYFLFFIFKINRLIFILQIVNKNIMLCGITYISILFYGLKCK